jgi:hypothetical protein
MESLWSNLIHSFVTRAGGSGIIVKIDIYKSVSVDRFFGGSLQLFAQQNSSANPYIA